MRTRAEMAPKNTVSRECFIAMMAAMKNVLSPISDTMITDKDAKKPWMNPVRVTSVGFCTSMIPNDCKREKHFSSQGIPYKIILFSLFLIALNIILKVKMDNSCEMAARVFRGKDYSIHAQTAEEADQIIIC